MIPGALDYAALSQLHRPTDPQALASEVRRLATTGLKPIDISVALRIDPASVREMLVRP